MRFVVPVLILCLATSRSALAGDPLSLDMALHTAIATNPELAATYARAEAEHAAIRAQYSPDNPRFGLMRENNMNFMEQEMGPMNSWSLSQELKFPAKYIVMGSAQKARAEGADQGALDKLLEVRGKVISTYYNLSASEQVIALFEAQKVTLREVARIAESRYSTGSALQQDQMKAHVEQAKVENDLLMANQERESMTAMLNAVLNREATDEVLLPKNDLPVPELISDPDSILKELPTSSKQIRAADSSLQESDAMKSLAGWNYAPDFMFSFRKAYTSAPGDAYAAAVEITIPFWFFLKQTSEHASASARAMESEKTLEFAVRNTTAEVKSLLAKAKSNRSLLRVYDTSLIPLVTNTYNSSQGAYRAGKTSFIELLDSERAVYETKISRYRTLAQYVESLVRLEQMAGRSVSSLPMGEIK